MGSFGLDGSRYSRARSTPRPHKRGFNLFCLILVSRQRPRAITVAAFPGIIVVSVVALFVTNGQLAASGVRFQAFLGFKAFLIMGALLVPEDLLIAVPFFVAGTMLPVIEWARWPAAWHTGGA